MLSVPRKDLASAPADDTEDGVGVADSVRDGEDQILSAASAASPRHQIGGRGEEGNARPDYSYRQANWAIGRSAEKANVTVKLFRPGDRFLAWQKRATRKAAAAERRAMGKNKGSARKGKQKQKR